MSVVRTGARVLLLDDDGRVLLIQERITDGTHWITPGGGVEAGEDLAVAAARELWEETGLRLRIDPASKVAFSQLRRWSYGGVEYDQTDHFFVARVPTDTPVAPAEQTAMEQETVLGERWWTVEDLESTTDTVEPPELAELLLSLS